MVLWVISDSGKVEEVQKTTFKFRHGH